MKAIGHYDPYNWLTGAAEGTCGQWSDKTPDGRTPRRGAPATPPLPAAEDAKGWQDVLDRIEDYQTKGKR